MTIWRDYQCLELCCLILFVNKFFIVTSIPGSCFYDGSILEHFVILSLLAIYIKVVFLYLCSNLTAILFRWLLFKGGYTVLKYSYETGTWIFLITVYLLVLFCKWFSFLQFFSNFLVRNDFFVHSFSTFFFTIAFCFQSPPPPPLKKM